MLARNLLIAFSLLLTPVALIGTNRTHEIAIIGNPTDHISEITAADLKSVFLGTKSSLKDAGQVRPVLTRNGPAHEVFLKEYLGKTDSALQTFYRSLVFSGQGSLPKTVNSDEEAIAYVARTRGAISYVDASTIAAGVKTIRVK